MKYHLRPVEIEAIQWTGDNRGEIEKFCGWENTMFYHYLDKNIIQIHLQINTLKGWTRANHGDYIVKGIHGEFYPCEEDIFNETYEKVEKRVTL